MTSIGDIADKYTILRLKMEQGLDVIVEMKEYEPTIKGLNVDYGHLLKINTLMWDIEDLITDEPKLEIIGALYLALRELNRRRVKAKNKITAKHGGHRERKKY